ncbi:hypothetical protein AV926_02330 [Myroides marinus]|uniref:PDZ domain-containing protein n=1 Tax=Myroides marinus TaxID=703342 RepID=A0A161S2F8_9FLAO|nr:aspartyl protease family protein [Myroides marinus]KZE72865.1 hypothetical protein AV926_02330 [Myroides marinus]
MKSLNRLWIVFIVSVFCAIQSSYGQNIGRLLNSTSIEHKSFKSTIKFETIGKHIIVKPVIKGKEYRMLFDTGAVTSMTPEMIKELNLKNIGKADVLDIDINANKLNYVKLDTLTLADIRFINVGALVLDHNSVVDFRCMNIDGFLGANIFRKAIWEIDYTTNEITFTDNIQNLDIPINTPKIRMYIGYGGVPSVTSYIGKHKIYNTVIDYGYGGGIALDYPLFKEILKNDSTIKYAEGFGTSTVGIYGEVKVPKFYIGKIDELKIGDLCIKDEFIDFGLRTRAFGASKLADYRVILDWKGKKAYFVATKDKQSTDFKTIGYGIALRDKQVYVSYLYKNSPAEKADIRIGDQVLKINDIDYKDVTPDKWCDIRNVWRFKKQNITLLRDQEVIHVSIESEVLIEI